VYLLVDLSRPRVSSARNRMIPSTSLSADLRGSWLTRAPIAHRGLHSEAGERPENSLAAVAACCDAGIPAELDVRLTRDGEVAVFHDRTLRRLTGRRGRVEDRDAAQLGALRLLGTRERIPMLTEVLELVDGRVGLLLELKCHDGGSRLERAVLRTLAGYGGDVAMGSFRRRCLRHLRDGEAAHAVGHLSRGYVLAARRVDPAFIGCRVAALPHRAVQRRRAAGAVVLAWTVRSRAEHDWALGHADNVIFEGYEQVAGPGAHAISAPRSAPRGAP
jgi:glycerophosphoryl diester phosphodiesterase